jgi:hypothetical protein
MIGGARARFEGLTEIPELNVGLFAFLLNYPWEFLQVPFYEGMQEARHWDAVLFCSRATVGDGVIAVLAFWGVAFAGAGRGWILRPTPRTVAAFTGIGLAVTLVLEWLATEVLDRWSYSDAMPELPVLGTGLLPVLQWILLPPLIVWFVWRQLT